MLCYTPGDTLSCNMKILSWGLLRRDNDFLSSTKPGHHLSFQCGNQKNIPAQLPYHREDHGRRYHMLVTRKSCHIAQTIGLIREKVCSASSLKCLKILVEDMVLKIRTLNNCKQKNNFLQLTLKSWNKRITILIQTRLESDENTQTKGTDRQRLVIFKNLELFLFWLCIPSLSMILIHSLDFGHFLYGTESHFSFLAKIFYLSSQNNGAALSGCLA